MELLFYLVVCLILLGLWASLLSAVLSIVKSDHRAWLEVGRNRAITACLVLVTGGIGGIYYWLRIWPELRRSDNSS